MKNARSVETKTSAPEQGDSNAPAKFFGTESLCVKPEIHPRGSSDSCEVRLRACLTLNGWALTATPKNPNGAFTVSRWGMVRNMVDLTVVTKFAKQVGAKE